MALLRWVVTSAVPRNDYVLTLEFADGKTGDFDMKPLPQRRPYARLQSVGLFMLAHVECGTVVWNDTVDIAPELLYEGCVVVGD